MSEHETSLLPPEAYLTPEQLQHYQDLTKKHGSHHTNPDKMMDYAEKVGELGDQLRGKYGKDVADYALWHLIAGSSILPDQVPTHFDFPGDDSIEKFIDEYQTP